MNDMLLIATKIKKTIEYINKSLDNYPHRYIELKQHIISDMFTLLEYSYIANIDIESNKYKSLSIVKIKMIDYYLKLSYKYELISSKKYESICKHLIEITKMIYSWRETCES